MSWRIAKWSKELGRGQIVGTMADLLDFDASIAYVDDFRIGYSFDRSFMKPTFLVMVLMAPTLVAVPIVPAQRKAVAPITVRTESYPRPPYSGATYYIYEQSGQAICTKLEVCNKFDECSAQYFKGAYRAKEDHDTGDPYQQTPAILIPRAKLNKHACLRRFKLLAS